MFKFTSNLFISDDVIILIIFIICIIYLKMKIIVWTQKYNMNQTSCFIWEA